MKEYVLGMILAGGGGTRLYPLTRDDAKPAVPFGGTYKLIDFTLSNFINSGFRHAYILTQYKSHSLNSHINLGWSFLPGKLDQFIDILPPQMRVGEEWYQGTADAIRQNIFHIKALKDEYREMPKYILILAGDHIYKADYRLMLEEHRGKGADMTIATTVKPFIETKNELGALETDKDGRITAFHEKSPNPVTLPDDKNNCLVSMGIYISDTEKLLEILFSYRGNDFGKDIIPAMQRDGVRLYAYDFQKNNGISKYWADVGKLISLYDANMELTRVEPRIDLHDEEWKIRTYTDIGTPQKSVDESMLKNSLVSNGCIITRSKVNKSILSPLVRIEDAFVENSIIFHGCKVENGAYVDRGIIDKNCVITKDVNLTPETVFEHEIKNITDNTSAVDDVRVESNIFAIPKGVRVSKK